MTLRDETWMLEEMCMPVRRPTTVKLSRSDDALLYLRTSVAMPAVACCNCHSLSESGSVKDSGRSQ